MMNFIRNKAKGLLSIVLWLVIASFIITIFAVWGAKQDMGGRDTNVVAKINRDTVSLSEVIQLWRQKVQQISESGVDLTEEREKELKKEVLNAIVENKLQLAYAKSLGISAPDEEIAQFIQGSGMFNVKGQFSKEQYLYYLQRTNQSEAQFFDQQRAYLTSTKLRNYLFTTVKITDDELKNYYLKRRRAINLKYVYFNRNNYLSKLNTDEDRLEDYYSKNKKDYEKPERVKASHILVMPDASPNSPTGMTDEGAKRLADELLARVKSGESFSGLARQYSKDPGSAAKGGELGWFGKGVMVPEFEDAAFALKPGQVSPVIKTNYGYHIIKCEEKDAGFEPTYEKVRAKVYEAVRKQDSMELAKKDVLNFAEQAKSPAAFDATAVKMKAPVLSASGVTQGSGNSGVVSDNFDAVAFDLNQGDISGAIEGANGYYVLMVTGESKAQFNEEKFKKEKEELASRLKSIKYNMLTEDLLASLKKKNKIELYEQNL